VLKNFEGIDEVHSSNGSKTLNFFEKFIIKMTPAQNPDPNCSTNPIHLPKITHNKKITSRPKGPLD